VKYIIEPVSLKLDIPKDVCAYLVSLGYLEGYNDFSGDLCIKSYKAKKEFNDMIVSLILKEKRPGVPMA